jgi:hypothetical protein
MNGQFDLGEVTPLRYFAAIAVVVGLLFGFITGGSDSTPLPLRLLQWQLQSCLPMALMVGSQLLLARLPAFERLNTWWQLALSGVVGATLFTPLALGIDAWLLGDPVSWTELVDEFLGVVPPVVICWLAINAPWVLGFRLQVTPGPAGSADGDPAERPLPGFMALVPAPVRGELLYLEAELHYVAVVTSRGRALILYNLRDAMDELAGWPGVHPHRSYWVSAAHVTGLRRRGRQGVLRIGNGDEVPVSRRNLAKVQAWYDARQPPARPEPDPEPALGQ